MVTPSSLWSCNAAQLRALLRARQCSAVEVTTSCIERIGQRDSTVRAFVDLDAEGALRQAAALDNGDLAGVLHGIPVAIKDTIDVAGLRGTFGTDIHRDRIPARDAEVVRKLRASGAVILGTTVSTEYAIARAGPTTNPHDPSRTPGGSSSGSAAAVAARMVPIAVGTQTVGSIVRPSTYCGIFGYKPPHGAVSTAGAMTLSPLLDHVGPMAGSVDDIVLAYRAMSEDAGIGANEGDARLPTTVLAVEGPYAERIESPTREALARARALLESHGLAVRAVELPRGFAQASDRWETILFRDLAVHHGGDRDRHGERMSDRLRAFIDKGRSVADEAYAHAAAEARALRAALLALLPVDGIILAPATDGVAPAFSGETGPSRLQGLWSLTGMPALAVPCGILDRLPVGVQLIGHPDRERLMLNAGRLFEVLWNPAD